MYVHFCGGEGAQPQVILGCPIRGMVDMRFAPDALTPAPRLANAEKA